MSNAQEVMEAQAQVVKTKQTEALSSRMLHGLEKITLERDEALRALAIKTADPKAPVVTIDATLASEFAVRREKLLKSEEEYKKADIESTYNENLLSIMKTVAQQK
jgi:hypothetical protein